MKCLSETYLKKHSVDYADVFKEKKPIKSKSNRSSASNNSSVPSSMGLGSEDSYKSS